MPASHPRLEAVSGIASCLALTIAALVLAGWAWDIEPLKRILPGVVAMNPMTAVAFVLAALSLWLQPPHDAASALASGRLRFARVAAAAVVVIGVLKLLAVAFGWDAGVDQWVFGDRLADADLAFPNRMAPTAALNFVLLGLALLTLDVTGHRGWRPAEWLAGAVFLVSLLALTGYAYGVPELHSPASFIAMAMVTAAVFTLLAFGVFAARPNSGMMAVVASPGPGGAMARQLFPGLVLAMLVLGWLRLEGQRRGFYGTGLGTALYAVGAITVFSLLIWRNATALHHADADRERLAAQQRDSAAQVRLLLDSTAEAIYGIDAHGHCTFINRACVRMLGHADSQALLGKDMHTLIHYARPDGTPYPVEDCRIYQAVRTATPTHVDDEVFWRADGTSFAAEYWSYPLRRDGRVVGAVVTFLDITARRQAEERLRQSEERTRAIIETASDAFIALDAGGTVLRWNRQAETMFGWSRDEAVGRRLADMILPHQYRARHEQGLRRFAATGEGPVLNKRIEITALRRGGEEFPVELAVWPVLTDGIHTFNAFIRDITERKQAEERLRQSEQEIERFFGLSLDMLCIASADGYFKRISPAFTKTLGWSVEEMLARPFLDFVHPEDHAATLAEVERQVAAGQLVMHFENRYLHKDGSWRVLSWRSIPHGELMYASARDVTESKQAEQRILDLNAELTERQVALEAANKELEAFSYSISHDLRAPLRHIDGYASMLHEDAGGQLDADMRRYLDSISDAARQMGALIDDLLAFSRLSRKPVELAEVDMHALVARIVDEAGGGERVSLGSLPTVQGDPVLLRQVWVNLLSNALKYSAPRGDDARIEISGEHGDDIVRYRIRDNGVGFDMRYADKLFGVFQRLHSQEEFEGTGVGLAIVQRILSRHGGTIRAEAEPGRGATFTFELPIAGQYAPDGQAVSAMEGSA